jgi:hypothetical protein
VELLLAYLFTGAGWASFFWLNREEVDWRVPMVIALPTIFLVWPLVSAMAIFATLASLVRWPCRMGV